MAIRFPVPRMSSFFGSHFRLPESVRITLWVVVWWLSAPSRDGHAESSLHYKFQSWQEDDNRVRVDAHYLEGEYTWDQGTKFKLTGLVDTITGATPSGQPAPAGSDQVPLATLVDRREAVQMELVHPFESFALKAGFGHSDESDYISDVWSLNSQLFLNQKNTTLLAGYARADDDVQPLFFDTSRDKTVHDAIIGITQVVSPITTVTANLTFGHARGYLSDPYKIIRQDTEILPGLLLGLTFPENRPDAKRKLIGFLLVNHAVESIAGAVEASYRLLDDDWGLVSHTFELAWFQRFGERFIVRPAVRFYRQSAADFYMIDLNDSSIMPHSPPTGRTPYYSADYRLSAMDTWMLGLKAIWEINEHFTVDATLERYLMNGRDGITSASAYVDASIFTVGVRWWR